MVVEPPSNITNIGGKLVWRVEEIKRSISLWAALFRVLFTMNIHYCVVLFFVHKVRPRCGLPSFKQVDICIGLGLEHLEYWVAL